MKKLLVLGGGINQLPLIEAAKEAGYYVIVCDFNQDPPGAKLCDKFYQASAGDRDVLVEIAETEKIDGVIANTEALMANVSYISQRFGLVGNPEEAVEKLLSKNKFRDLQESIGVYCPKHIKVETLSEAADALQSFTYPVILKPCESSGSRGTTVIHDKDAKEDLLAAFNACKTFSRNGLVVIEEFVEWADLDILEAEMFVHEGQILWDGLMLTLRSVQLPLIPMAILFPFPYSDIRLTKTKEVLEKITHAAGIVHGEYNAELYFSKSGQLFVLEINPRQGGSRVPYYAQKSSGVDFHKLLVSTAVGDNSYWEELKTFKRLSEYIVVHSLYPLKTGRFVSLEIDERLKPYVTNIDLSVSPGEQVEAAENAEFIIGYVELAFPNAEIQLELSRHLEQYISIIVD